MTERTTGMNHGETVRFIGNWHESIPRILFMDPFMNSHDRNVYCVIRSLMSERGVVANQEMHFPTYSEIMKYGNIGSKSTVAKAIAMARLIGWIIQSNPAKEMGRDETTGRFTHKQWLIVDEPMHHSEICRYDHNYVAFTKEAMQHKDTQISALAHKIHEVLMNDLEDESHQQSQQSIYARRIESYQAIKSEPGDHSKSCFFGIPIPQKERTPPSTGGVHGENHRVQEAYTVPSSSSSSKTTTTENTETLTRRKKLYERIGFNPNYQSIYSARFDKLPEEYQELVILEMHERMDRKLNRNDPAYLGHLLKTTLSAVEQNDPGSLIFTPEYSTLSPAEKPAGSADPVTTLKRDLKTAHADYRHWQQIRQSATDEQGKQVEVMAEMAKTKIKALESKLSSLQ